MGVFSVKLLLNIFCLIYYCAFVPPTVAADQNTAEGAPQSHHPSQILVRRWPDGGNGWPSAPRGTDYLRKDAVSGIGLLGILDGTSAVRKAASVRSTGDFEFVELDHHVEVHSGERQLEQSGSEGVCPHRRPNGRLWGYQWGAHAVHADAAWCHSRGTAVTVAVIDTGVDTTHPDLRTALWVNEAEAYGVNGVDDDGNGYIDDVHGYDFVSNTGHVVDDHRHGTHVAGIIAAGSNEDGVAGIAPGAKLMALRFIDSDGNAPISQAVFAVLYAISKGADIISISWGSAIKSQALETAFNMTVEGGQLVVCSAGNGGTSLDSDGALLNYPTSFQMPNMITVAAASASLHRYSSSNYGVYSVDIAAPGTDIMSTIPVGKGAYGLATGTSQSVPHVSGVAALVAAISKTSREVDAAPSLRRSLWLKEVLLGSATYVPALAPFVRTAGIVDAYRAVFLAIQGTLPLEIPEVSKQSY